MIRFALATLFALLFTVVLATVGHAAGIVPLWPSTLLSGCNYTNNSPPIGCAAGGSVSTAINAQYPSERVIVSLTLAPFSTTGPVLQVYVTSTANDGATCYLNGGSITDSGIYTCDFSGQTPGVPNQLVFTACCNGVYFAINSIGIQSLGVAPTQTPVNTPLPGTPYPTSTNVPSGGATYTRTPTAPIATATPTVTTTPLPDYNCGDVTFPLLNCTYRDGYNGSLISGPIPNVRHWSSAGNGNAAALPEPDGSANCSTHCAVIQGGTEQVVVAGATGEAWVQFGSLNAVTPDEWFTCISGNACVDISGSLAYTNYVVDLGHVNSGTSYTFLLCETSTATNCIQNGAGFLSIYNIWVGGTANTPTPGPTSTVTATRTPGPATATAIGTPTATVPIGSTPTPIAVATMCWDACAPFQLSPIPQIIGTQIVIPTGPFSYLTTLSLGRTPCTSFGKVPILVPYVTPVGALTPLSYVWGQVTPIALSTVVNNTGIISGTDVIPCADPQIPSGVWDASWYGSLMLIFMCFVGWLIWFVHRLFNNQGTAD